MDLGFSKSIKVERLYILADGCKRMIELFNLLQFDEVEETTIELAQLEEGECYISFKVTPQVQV